MSEVSQRLEPVSIYLCIFRKRQFLYCLVKVNQILTPTRIELKKWISLPWGLSSLSCFACKRVLFVLVDISFYVININLNKVRNKCCQQTTLNTHEIRSKETAWQHACSESWDTHKLLPLWNILFIKGKRTFH
jgi:hypothetical protein